MMLRAVLLVSLTVVAGQAVSDTRFTQPPGVTGCYSVEVGQWSGGFPSQSPDSHQPPSFIRLDSALVEGRFSHPGVRRVEPHIPALTRYRTLPPNWRISNEDLLVVTWSSGFVGVRLELALPGDSLRGRAVALYDVIGPPVPTAPVVLVKRSCSEFPLR